MSGTFDPKYKLWNEIVDLPNNKHHVRRLTGVTLTQTYPHHCIIIDVHARGTKEKIVCFRDIRGKITIQKDDGKGNLIYMRRHDVENIRRLIGKAAHAQKADSHYLSKTKEVLRVLGLKAPRFLR